MGLGGGEETDNAGNQCESLGEGKKNGPQEEWGEGASWEEGRVGGKDRDLNKKKQNPIHTIKFGPHEKNSMATMGRQAPKLSQDFWGGGKKRKLPLKKFHIRSGGRRTIKKSRYSLRPCRKRNVKRDHNHVYRRQEKRPLIGGGGLSCTRTGDNWKHTQTALPGVKERKGGLKRPPAWEQVKGQSFFPGLFRRLDA